MNHAHSRKLDAERSQNAALETHVGGLHVSYVGGRSRCCIDQHGSIAAPRFQTRDCHQRRQNTSNRRHLKPPRPGDRGVGKSAVKGSQRSLGFRPEHAPLPPRPKGRGVRITTAQRRNCGVSTPRDGLGAAPRAILCAAKEKVDAIWPNFATCKQARDLCLPSPGCSPRTGPRALRSALGCATHALRLMGVRFVEQEWQSRFVRAL